MKGKLPISGECHLESCEEQWRLVLNGILNELKTSFVVTLPENQLKKFRIKITITNIISPESLQSDFYTETTLLNDSANISDCLKRTHDVIIRKYLLTKWIFTGYINNDINRIPLVITHYPVLGISAYSQQLNSDKQKVSSAMMN